MISPYTAVAGLHFRNTMVRRVDHLSTIGSGLILAYGLSFLWQTLYENDFVLVEIPIGLMVSYAVLGSVLSTAWQTDIVFTIQNKIETGDIVIDLLRPARWQAMIMAEYAGLGFAQLIVIAPLVVVVSAIFWDFEAPVSALAGAVFVVSAVIGVVINFGIVYLTLLLGFKFTQIGGFEFAVRGLRPLLTGAFVPLWIFPDAIADVLKFSPFPYTFFAPLSIYVGVAEGSEIWTTLAVQILWAAGITGIGAFFTYRAMRKLVVQGG